MRWIFLAPFVVLVLLLWAGACLSQYGWLNCLVSMDGDVLDTVEMDSME